MISIDGFTMAGGISIYNGMPVYSGQRITSSLISAYLAWPDVAITPSSTLVGVTMEPATLRWGLASQNINYTANFTYTAPIVATASSGTRFLSLPRIPSTCWC